VLRVGDRGVGGSTGDLNDSDYDDLTGNIKPMLLSAGAVRHHPGWAARARRGRLPRAAEPPSGAEQHLNNVDAGA
jgi:hypothetical protein